VEWLSRVMANRVPVRAELANESFPFWVTAEYQRALYDLLVAAGREHGLKPFGRVP
jgi:glycine cleavage system aminomethyltransferase T